jgi:hypothetical protein
MIILNKKYFTIVSFDTDISQGRKISMHFHKSKLFCLAILLIFESVWLAPCQAQLAPSSYKVGINIAQSGAGCPDDMFVDLFETSGLGPGNVATTTARRLAALFRFT